MQYGESSTTLGLEIDFLKRDWNARLRATGRGVKRCESKNISD
jgi:hypothetical protein